MIGFKNAWYNIAALMAFIISSFYLNEIFRKDPNHVGLWVTTIVCVSGIMMALINITAVGNKKEHQNMVTKEELKLVIDQLKQFAEATNKQMEQHINSNDESYNTLFDFSKRNEAKTDKIIDLLIGMKIDSKNGNKQKK